MSQAAHHEHCPKASLEWCQKAPQHCESEHPDPHHRVAISSRQGPACGHEKVTPKAPVTLTDVRGRSAHAAFSLQKQLSAELPALPCSPSSQSYMKFHGSSSKEAVWGGGQAAQPLQGHGKA